MIDLINGDVLEKIKGIKSNSIATIMADLPYGTTGNKWDSLLPLDILWRELTRIGKIDTQYVFTASGGFQFTLYNSNPALYKYDMIWDKIIPSGMTYARYQPMRQHEYVLVFYNQRGVYNPQVTQRDKPIKSGGQKNLNSDSTTIDKYKIAGFKKEYTTKQPTTIMPFMKIRKGAKHRTQKPLELIEYLIKTYTNEGDTVFDPTFGSGTTAVACKNLNRNFVGIELDTDYYNYALERIKGNE